MDLRDRCLTLAGEAFDITCFTGINQYHCLRVEGECGPTHLSSQHIRSVDFEVRCSTTDDQPNTKEAFEGNTRQHFLECLTYQASIHLAYEGEKNHERIGPNSFACIQATRDDLQLLGQQQLDPGAEIVTLLLDVVTDRRHFHLVKASAAADDSSASRLRQQVMLMPLSL